MKFILRLYNLYDQDLIVLRKYYKFRFTTEIRNIIHNHVRGTVYQLIVPDDIISYMPDDIDKKRSFTSLTIRLNEKADMAEINWILNIKPNHRNMVIKSLLRNALTRYPFEIHMIDDGESRAGYELEESYEIVSKPTPTKTIKSSGGAAMKDGKTVHTPTLKQKNLDNKKAVIYENEGSGDSTLNKNTNEEGLSEVEMLMIGLLDEMEGS